MKLIPKYEFGDKIIKYSGTNIYNKNGQDYIVEHKSPNDIPGYNKNLANYYITLPEVTVTSKRKTLPNDLASSLSKAASLGIVDIANPLNALSLSNYIGTGRRLINGEPIGKTLIEGSNGAFSDKVNSKHPVLSSIGNIILDSAIPLKLLSSKLPNVKALAHNTFTEEVAPQFNSSISGSRVIKVPKFLDTFSDKVFNYIKKPLQNSRIYKAVQNTKLYKTVQDAKFGNLQDELPNRNYEYNFNNNFNDYSDYDDYILSEIKKGNYDRKQSIFGRAKDYIDKSKERVGTLINAVKNPSETIKDYHLAKYDKNIKEASDISSNFYNNDVLWRKKQYNVLNPSYSDQDKAVYRHFDLFGKEDKDFEGYKGYYQPYDKLIGEPSVHISKQIVGNERELVNTLTHEFNHFGNLNLEELSDDYKYAASDAEKNLLKDSYIFDKDFLDRYPDLDELHLSAERNASNRELRQAISYDKGDMYKEDLNNAIDAMDDNKMMEYLKYTNGYTGSFYNSLKHLNPTQLHNAINKIKYSMKYIPAVAGGAIGVNQIKKANH